MYSTDILLQRLLASESITLPKDLELTEGQGVPLNGSALPSSIPPKPESEIPASAKAASGQVPGSYSWHDQSHAKTSGDLGARDERSAEDQGDEEQGESAALLGDRPVNISGDPFKGSRC